MTYQGDGKSVIATDQNTDLPDISPTAAIVEDEMSDMKILQKVAQRTIRPNREANDYILTIHSVIYNLDDLSTLWCGNEQYADINGMFKYKFDEKKKCFLSY